MVNDPLLADQGEHMNADGCITSGDERETPLSTLTPRGPNREEYPLCSHARKTLCGYLSSGSSFPGRGSDVTGTEHWYS